MMRVSPVYEAAVLSGGFQEQTTCTHCQLLHPPLETLASNLNNPHPDHDIHYSTMHHITDPDQIIDSSPDPRTYFLIHSFHMDLEFEP